MEEDPDDYDWEWIKYVYDNLPLNKILNINQLLVQDIDEIKQPIKYTIEQDGKEKEIINLNINNARVLEYYNDPIEITTNGDKTFDVGEEELDMPVMQYNFKVNVPSNLETWNNKRFTSNISTTISNLMADSTKNGVDKESRITIDVPELQVTQISNYSITNNGTQNIPIPSGYDAVDSISVNVDVDYSNRILGYYEWNPTSLPEAMTIASYNIANNTNYLGFNTIYCNPNIAPASNKIILNKQQFYTKTSLTATTKIFLNWTVSTSQTAITLSKYDGIVIIEENSDYYKLTYFANKGSSQVSATIYSGNIVGRYSGTNYYYLFLCEDSSAPYMSFYGGENYYSYRKVIYLYKSNIEIV